MKLKKTNPKDLSFILGCGGTAKGVGRFMGLGILTLQNMKNYGPIGSIVDPKNTVAGTASVYFITEDSVSELIAQLTKMRKDMKQYTTGIVKTSKKIGITLDATKIEPLGNSNKRRKVSRSRAKR